MVRDLGDGDLDSVGLSEVLAESVLEVLLASLGVGDRTPSHRLLDAVPALRRLRVPGPPIVLTPNGRVVPDRPHFLARPHRNLIVDLFHIGNRASVLLGCLDRPLQGPVK